MRVDRIGADSDATVYFDPREDSFLIRVALCVDDLWGYVEQHAVGLDPWLVLATDGWRTVTLPFAALEQSIIIEIHDVPKTFVKEILFPYAMECGAKHGVTIHRVCGWFRTHPSAGVLQNPEWNGMVDSAITEPLRCAILSIALPESDLNNLIMLLQMMPAVKPSLFLAGHGACGGKRKIVPEYVTELARMMRSAGMRAPHEVDDLFRRLRREDEKDG